MKTFAQQIIAKNKNRGIQKKRLIDKLRTVIYDDKGSNTSVGNCSPFRQYELQKSVARRGYSSQVAYWEMNKPAQVVESCRIIDSTYNYSSYHGAIYGSALPKI